MAEPISLVEAKKHLRVDASGDDTLIQDKIVAAREWVEEFTGLVLTRRSVTESLKRFDDQINLRAWPIAADEPITITYRDSGGIDRPVAGATVRAASRPGALFPAAGTHWPSNCAAGSIEVRFTAGFATPESIPQMLKQAMLVMLTGFYEDREGGALFAAAERSARGLCRAKRGRML